MNRRFTWEVPTGCRETSTVVWRFIFPVEDEKLKARRSVHILEVQLADNVKAQYLRPDGTYAKRNRRGKEPVCAQDTFCAEAVQAAKEAGKKQDPAAMRVFIPLEQ